MLSYLTDISLWGLPLLAGVMIVLSHVVFGREVLRRGIIFIDLTLAQMAALGVVLADLLGMEHPIAVQCAAVSTALLASAALASCERRWPHSQEAIIGSVYVVAASLVLILIAGHPHAAEQLQSMLSGQLLWLQMQQLWPAALLFLSLLGLWFGLAKHRKLLFYPLFAIMVTTSVQMVGLYLVFASLILPALAVRSLAEKPGLLWGWLLGSIGYFVGILASISFDWPTGPSIVCCLAGVCLLAAPWLWRNAKPDQ